MRLAYDTETDGLFPDDIRPGTKNFTAITRVHCLVTQDIDTGEVRAYYDDTTIAHPAHHGSLKFGVTQLLLADRRYAHNGLLYDERVLREFFPDYWARRGPGAFRDSQVGGAAIWPTEHLRRLDSARIAKARANGKTPFPAQLVGRHSLESWGVRFGNRKAKFEGGFEKFTPDMLAYCVQDVSTLTTLVKKIEAKIAAGQFSDHAWELEQDFKLEIHQQNRNGFAFDIPAAERLTADLQGRRADLTAALSAAVPPFENHSLTDPEVVANAAARAAKWEAATVDTAATPRAREKAAESLAKARKNLEEKRAPKVEVVPFNPGSRHHIARHLMERHGWKPDAREGYTATGDVKVDESVLAGLGRYPLVDKLIEYQVASKVLGMLAESKKKDAVPWMKMVQEDGKIHGIVDHNGAVTSRCTHRRPNMTQVPKVGNPFGAECRGLFVPSPGNVLVGVDASGLELRMLGHFLEKYDGGEYLREVTQGDVHRKNQIALGIADGPTARDTAKRAIYAELYGAGEEKLGKTIDPAGTPMEQKARGRAAKRSLLAKVKGLRELKTRCAALHKKCQSLNLPDGRRAWTRSDYASLNTLLQAAGAIVMKLAVVLMHRQFRAAGLAVKQVHQAHDEVQLDVRPEIAERVRSIGCGAIEQAGIELGIKCPLKGAAKIGRNWAETH